MKKNTMKALLVSMLVFMFLGTFMLGGYFSKVVEAETSNSPTSEINVNGVGVVKAKPDVGIINLAVDTSNIDSKKSQEENSRITNELMAALKKAGIKEEDIKTAYYNMFQERHYNHTDGSFKDGSFRAIHSLEVMVRDIDRVGLIVDTAVKNGANQVNHIRFTVSNPDLYYREALKLAVKDAKGKAETIAEVLEVRIGKPTQVTEISHHQPVFGRQFDLKMEAAVDMQATPITTGELEITASVQVTYGY